MSMSEMFKKGYTIIIGSMWGEHEAEDLEECLDYEEDTVLKSVDTDLMIAYFYDSNDYDD